MSMADLMAELEVRGRATIKRYLDYLKDTVGIPIRYDRAVGGYRIDRDDVSSETGMLGLWFSAPELHALLTMNQLLRRIEPGVLRDQMIIGDHGFSRRENRGLSPICLLAIGQSF